MKFYITTNESITRTYKVYADTEDEAREQFLNGEFDSIVTENIDDVDVIEVEQLK